MEIDRIQINFNQEQLLLLNLLLAFIIFGVSLDISLGDFKRIFQKPKAPVIGLLSEYLLLPLLTLGLIALFRPAPSLALGMVLIAVCPGGSVSNFMVALSKGNIALSVTLTSVTMLASIVVTPLAFSFWSGFVDKPDSLASAIQVDAGDMVRTIVLLVFIPVVLGMWVNARFTKFARKIDKTIRRLSILVFLGFVFFALMGNYDNMVRHLGIVFWLVLVHNGLSLVTGYFFPKALGLPEPDARAISIETGIQNSGLGLVFVFNFFDGIGGMAMILAWWGVWHLISGFALSLYWGSFRKLV